MLGFAAFAVVSRWVSPPNVSLELPASNSFLVRLDGETVLRARVSGLHGRDLKRLVSVTQFDEPVQPMFLGYPHGPKTADWAPAGEMKRSWHLTFLVNDLVVTAFVSSGYGRRACSTDTQASLSSTFGEAVSTLDDSVYDRNHDWLLTIHSPINRTASGFRFTAKSPDIELKPDYYRDHLGYFLWDKSKPLWAQPVAGWCSWAAYGQEVTQKNVESAASFFSTNLREYGYTVIQIDDGYQRVRQITDNHQPITEPFSHYWTKPNEKFPQGMDHLAQAIAGLGMTPGIWIGLYLPLGLVHQKDYVMDSGGQPLQGPWVGYSVDSGRPEAVSEAYTEALKTFRRQGWKYFKIDTLRHILYDSYRRVPDFWTARGTDSSHAYRRLFAAVRAAVGRQNYLLACWGALPELAGIPDGCRIGEDVGPSFESMRKSAKYIAQFQYANNVIWRNDPDYMCLRVPLAQCKAWATLTSLTGEHVMVSDPVETYDADRVDVLRRVGPPCFTQPENVKPMPPDPEWITLHASKSTETWTVAARMAWQPLAPVTKPVRELGLNPNLPYLAFDFWNSKFLGVVSRNCAFEALAPGTCQVVGFRPLSGHPQVLGDDRHVGQGAYELKDVQWDGKRLSGQFRCAPGRNWHLYVYVPDGYKPVASQSAEVIEPHVWKMSFPISDGWRSWKVQF